MSEEDRCIATYPIVDRISIFRRKVVGHLRCELERGHTGGHSGMVRWRWKG